MSLRIGAGFRLGRHVYIGMSIPLGHHARRLGRHQGHGNADPISFLVGCVIMYAFVMMTWALAWPGG
jgi:hypothetical protein